MKRVIALCLILLIITVTSAWSENIVLTDSNPDTTITTGTTATVYGTAGANHVTIESGANAKLVNFSGINTITIEADSSNFTVSRSGATVTFEGNDGTVVQMPVTATTQTIIFNDVTKQLFIKSQQVILGSQVIFTTPVAVSSPKCSEHPFHLP